MAAAALQSFNDRLINQALSAEKFQFLYRPKRYKVAYGGRGGCKSWEYAQYLILQAYQRTVRIGCFREYQNSIKDSVHQLLCDTIKRLHLEPWFSITQTSIRSITTGSNFIFEGLHGRTALDIKSLEGIDIAWVEEAQTVSKTSWELLIPTIRKPGSEILVTFNPIEEGDDTYQRFIVKPPPEEYAFVIKVGWEDNPWFPEVLDIERRILLAQDPEAYEHVWGGGCRVIGDAVILKGKYQVHNFDTPDDPGLRFFHGSDFGYGVDPATLIRMWTTGDPRKKNEELWIDRECYGHQVELDEYDTFYSGGIVGSKQFDGIETAKHWPIKADNSRPETISFIRKQGYKIDGAEKWNGSIEDGITHLRGFRTIHIHERCKHVAQEARLYSWKVDRVSGDILPIAVDKHNHCWDAVRYALDGYIRRRGAGGMWRALGK